ncbi:1-phosphofructokinase [Motilibacter peucedani]|uniref:1-phosphofructokinase n=1 Tax=Motilibacter peucedani TaxID=598650 RepID=A0A420XQB8_9ACTN|nr:1-phosphofructokinase family hexose kinase [Motilibacter peucedani]RKS75491.1 1-phosphofructokinase [Motilibacter peucedani]
MIATVTANPSIDLTYELDALARGELHRARVLHVEPSGKGVNVARALLANGLAARAVLPTGGPAGAQLQALLAAEQVPALTVPVAGGTRVNVTLAEPGGLATKVNAPGPALTADEVEALVTAVARAAADADTVVVSGSLPPGAEPALVARLCRAAASSGARVALDTSGPGLLAGLEARPHVVKPNLDELAEATGGRAATWGEVEAAARTLLAAGAGSALISAGAEGALLVGGSGTWLARVRVASPLSTVGAGDALLAGFVAAGGDGPEALREAVAWAGAALLEPGSRVPLVTDAHRRAVELADPPPPHTALRGAS